MGFFSVITILLLDNTQQPVKIVVEPFYYNKDFILATIIIAVMLVLLLITSVYFNKICKKKN